MQEYTTTTDFGGWYTIASHDDEKTLWLVDSGYPYNHHRCDCVKEFVNLDGKKEAMDQDGVPPAAVCDMLSKVNVDGILGGQYLADKYVKLMPIRMEASHERSYEGKCVDARNEIANYTSILVDVCHDDKCVESRCFLDTGGQVAFINQTLADSLGFETRVAGTVPSGAGQVNTYESLSEITLRAKSDNGDVDLSTPSQMITDDNNSILNVIHRKDALRNDAPFACSIGTGSFSKFNSIYFAKPDDKICFD